MIKIIIIVLNLNQFFFMHYRVYLKTGYSFSADVWSFGMLLYELIAGHLPYHDCEPRKIAAKVMAGELPVWPAEADASGTYKPLMKVAKRCWKIEPAERPSSAELVTMLKKLQR